MSELQQDRIQAVEQAVALFWNKGYGETSVEDIVRATGLNRYAIYNLFGGKREMLLEALAVFIQQRKEAFMDLFHDPSMKPMQAIQHMFISFIDEVMKSGNGCLMCNTVSEIAPKDPEIAEVCRAYQYEFIELIRPALVQAQSAGELQSRLEIEATAQALLIFKVGLATMAKAGARRGELLGALEAQMGALMTTRKINVN